MARKVVYRNSVADSGSGNAGITLPAGAAIAVYSAGGARILQWANFPQYPQKFIQVATVAPDTQVVTSTFASGAVIVLEGYGDEVYYEVGTAPIVQFATGSAGAMGTASAVNTSATLTVANIFSQVITSSTAAAVTGTLMTGTVMDAGGSFNVGDAFDFTVINTGATNTFTIATATGWTLVGNMVVALSSSGRFRLQKTAANTFSLYRLS